MKIEKGIPLPEPFSGGRPKGEYGRIVDQMVVGDSVLCGTEVEADGIRSAAAHRKFKTRRRKEAGGWRVWIAEKGKPEKREAPSTKAIPVIATPPVTPQPAGDPPPMDDPRVTELHALCLARRCNARVANAQSWVAKGVTADRLREALDTLAATGAALNVGALTPLLLQPGIQ